MTHVEFSTSQLVFVGNDCRGVRIKIMLLSSCCSSRHGIGFSDSNIVLPGGHQPDTAMEVLFYVPAWRGVWRRRCADGL